MLNNKKVAMGFICAGLAAIAAALVVVILRPSDYTTKIPEALDETVARSAFIRENVSLSDTTIDGKSYWYAAVTDPEMFIDSECIGEGHVILGYRKHSDSVDVYALCSLIGYGFRDGMLVDNMGSFCIPTLIQFDKTDNGEYIFKDAQEVMDGGEFVSSIKKMFPADLANKAISAQTDEGIRALLTKQCERYAAAYLKVLGRKATISSYQEQNFLILSNYGVSSDVENALCDLHPEYGFYVGSFEKLEADGRYVYSLKWDGDNNGNGTVTYTKSRYDTDEIIEKFDYRVKGDKFTEIKQKKKKK